MSARAATWSEALLGRPVLLLTIFVTTCVLGVIAYLRVPLQMMPDGFTSPGLQVFIRNPGASAAESESRVTRPIEEELRTLPGIESIDSITRQDSIVVWLSFRADTDMDLAKAEVRDRVERSRAKLPDTVREIGIWSWSNSSMPIAFVAILHDGDSARTDFLVEEVVKRRIEAVDGVGKVEVWGSLADSMRVLLDEDRVKAANLDLGALIRRLSADNFAQPLGEVEDGGRRVLLRADMRFKTPEEVAAFPIGDGLVIGDIGRVENVKSVRQRLSRIDGRYAYFAQVEKDGQANAVDAARGLRTALAELETDPRLAGTFRFKRLFDQGEFIERSLGDLRETAVLGGLLAVLVLFVFLWRVRLTFVVALSIPVSTLVAIAWSYFTGGSFNVLTMMGITLAMGMLVDNAIVVVENITRYIGLGRTPRQACAEGTSEVGLAITLSTLTTVVVFAPLIFLNDNPQFRLIFSEIGTPLIVSLLASLVVALVFLPVQALPALRTRPAIVQAAAARFAPLLALPARAVAWTIGGVRAITRALLRALALVLVPLVRVLAPLRVPLALAFLAVAGWRAAELVPWALQMQSAGASAALPGGANELWLEVVGLALAGIAAAALAFFGLRGARRNLGTLGPASGPFVPRGTSLVGFLVDANEALVRWSLLHRWKATLAAVACFFTILYPRAHMEVASFGQDENASRLQFWIELEENFTLGQAEDEMIRYEAWVAERADAWGRPRVLTDFNTTGGRLRMFWDTPLSEDRMRELRQELREGLPRYAGHRLQFVDEDQGSTTDLTVVTFRLVGPDSGELERIGARAVALLEGVDGLSNLRSPLSAAPPQIDVKIDAEVAERLGVSAQDALRNVSWALSGARLPEFQEAGREIPFLVEYDDTQVAGLSTLRDIDVFTRAGAVPLQSFSDLEFGRGQRAISRHDGRAAFTIQARCDSPARQGELAAAGRRALAELDLPRGYELDESGLADERMAEELASILSALALSLVLVFLLMGVLFESFALPVTVMFTVPFAVVGAYWALWLTKIPMDSVGWIGIIVLGGVVVNNGIVLVDRIHQLRSEGVERARAVVEACGNRVRPILMTALTSVLGLVPMILAEPQGEGIDYRALATCVAGGLVVSTFFTLWVVPLAYTVVDDVRMAAALGYGRGLGSVARKRTSEAPVRT